MPGANSMRGGRAAASVSMSTGPLASCSIGCLEKILSSDMHPLILHHHFHFTKENTEARRS
uniref:Uncharacterized protein n=1 Tax=Molossus molossus TaxID=27622 RepID=A0A7J8FYW6_MOLMO|nr:hypothetical protein HJG59_008268 [Molossus molossus]